MLKLHEVQQGTSEWHDLRAGKYTGSSAHKVLKYGAIEYSLTDQGEFGGNWYTRRGHILEEEAIELYEAIKKTTVQRPGFVTNSRYPNCGYSPDGLLDDRVIEVKCFNEAKHLQLYKGNVPLEVLAQIYFGMLICERKLANLIIYNPELEPKLAFKIIEVKYRRAIFTNFKRILQTGEVAHAK